MIWKPSHADGHGGNECDALPAGGDEPVGESHPRKALHIEIALTSLKDYSQPLPFAKWSKWAQCQVRRWYSRRTSPASDRSNGQGTQREALWPLGSFPVRSWVIWEFLCCPFLFVVVVDTNPDWLDDDEVTIGQIWRSMVPVGQRFIKNMKC